MKNIVLYILKFYKKKISGFLSLNLGSACRYTPTCSEYAIQAIEDNGLLKGSSMGIRRFLSCNSYSKKSFYDPVSIEKT